MYGRVRKRVYGSELVCVRVCAFVCACAFALASTCAYATVCAQVHLRM